MPWAWISDWCLDCGGEPHTMAAHTENGCIIAGCECKSPGGRYKGHADPPPRNWQLFPEEAEGGAR